MSEKIIVPLCIIRFPSAPNQIRSLQVCITLLVELIRKWNITFWFELLETWLVLTSVNYQRNLKVLIVLNQWLAPAMI